MASHLKHFFIPHEGNGYHPHILHTKRAVFYSAFFLALKAAVFAFAVFIPSVVFVMPDVLAEEEIKLLTLTNNLRLEKGLPLLLPISPLHVSSDLKASDMADLHYFSHNSPSGYGLSYFLKNAGYNYEVAGENLAMGFSSAEEIFSSWMKSPTHYANLVDPDFKEFGVAIKSGTYDDLATVYVAQHFSTPKLPPTASFPEAKEKPLVLALEAVTPVLEESSVPTTTPPIASIPVKVIGEDSFVDFQEIGDKTFFEANVHIQGEVQSATLMVNTYSFPLEKNDEGLYRGTVLVLEPANNFFKPIIEPSIQIVGVDGTVVHSVVSWKHIKIVSPTPLEKYTRAKELPGLTAHIFEFSRGVYLFFIIFFSAALLLSIAIEVRRQHHHIIVQTLGLILLLCSLFVV